MKQLRGKLIFGLIFGLAVVVGLGIYADFAEMLRLLRAFNWWLLPFVLGLTALNYALRFSKWHYYLRQIGVTNISVWDNLRIFLGGFGLSLTPGKVGELVRLWWFKNRAGVHPAKTAPMAFAERLTDGIAMALLSLLGGLAYPQYWPAVAVIGAILLLAVMAIQIRPLALWGLSVGEQLPLVSRVAHHLRDLYESAYVLFRPKNLMLAVGLGSLAWVSEGVAFYLVLVGLGVPPSGQLLWQAIFILAFAFVAGGASGLPGGLGVTEGGLTGLLQLLVGVPENIAATATLLIRFGTMWFGVVSGLLIMAIWREFLFGAGDETPDFSMALERDGETGINP